MPRARARARRACTTVPAATHMRAHAQAAYSVAIDQQRPAIDLRLRRKLEPCAEVIHACWQQDATRRPSMPMVVERMVDINAAISSAEAGHAAAGVGGPGGRVSQATLMSQIQRGIGSIFNKNENNKQ